jgi:hypothetical protein
VSTELVQTYDGVGVVQRGNLVLMLYNADARLHRTRWIFDRADELAKRNPGGIYVLIVIAPGSGLPDAATRAENATRFNKLGPNLKMMVTVAIGDDFRVSIVRTLMRAMILLSRQSARHVVAVTEAEGIARLLEGARSDPNLPMREQIEADLAALHAKLPTRSAA